MYHRCFPIDLRHYYFSGACALITAHALIVTQYQLCALSRKIMASEGHVRIMTPLTLIIRCVEQGVSLASDTKPGLEWMLCMETGAMHV